MMHQHLHRTSLLRRSAALLIACLVATTACAQYTATPQESTVSFRMRAPQVNDSFTIFIHFPAGYNGAAGKKYPVVFVLDANLYFDLLSPMANKYAEVGLLPPVLLVGVGYQNFEEMDRLRERDYTWPIALPEYGMQNSGGAPLFLRFLQETLIPRMDTLLRTDTSRRMLFGHSLSGYFTAYALLQHLASGNGPFRNYIAASPSLHYNHYWLPDQLRTIPRNTKRNQPRAYFTFGGKEDEEDAGEPGMWPCARLRDTLNTRFRASSVPGLAEIYSGLGHMETALPSFLHALTEAWGQEDH